MDKVKAQTDAMFATGGMKKDPVSGNEVPVGSLPHEVRDDVDAKLSEGEFVLPADVVRFIGLDRLMKMRDKAKEGLQRMNEMGQMGNSDEAAQNGEDPLGQFDGEDEDDEGFEAEIDDIMGSNVEMATGGSVPSATSNLYNLLGQQTDNPYWGDLTKIQGAKKVANIGEGRGIRDMLKQAALKLGYTGQLYGPSGAQDLGGIAAQMGITPEQLAVMQSSAGGSWQKDGDVTKRDQMIADTLRADYTDKQILDWLTSQGFTVDTVDTGREHVQQLRGPNGEMVAVDASNYINDNKAVDRMGMAGALITGGLAAYGGLGGAAASGGGTSTLSPTLTGATPTVTTGSIAPGTAGLTGGAPIVSTPGVAGFGGGLGGAEIAAMPAGLSGGTISAGTAGLTGGAPLVATPGVAGFGGAAMGGAELAALPATIGGEGLTLGGVLTGVGKEVGKGLAVGVAKDALLGGGSGGGGVIPGLIAGGAIGSALAGGSDSPSTPTADAIKAGRGSSGGNNPVVDYRPVDGQMEELFINNRPTGKKKKRGMATGGDVLSNYDFFKDN